MFCNEWSLPTISSFTLNQDENFTQNRKKVENIQKEKTMVPNTTHPRTGYQRQKKGIAHSYLRRQLLFYFVYLDVYLHICVFHCG